MTRVAVNLMPRKRKEKKGKFQKNKIIGKSPIFKKFLSLKTKID